MFSTKVGIDKMSLYIPEYFVNMVDLANERGIDPDKFTIGIGQSRMAVPPIWQDIVSMGANAANRILNDNDRAEIDQVIFATESSFDYSKSAATFIHQLLGINKYAKSYEIKQACYAGTAGLNIAINYVRLNPDRKVLVIASDVARYGLKTNAEATQGAGAVAMLVSANPRILTIDPDSYSYTDNQFDFWRPEYASEAMVNGKFSNELYYDVFNQVMQQVSLEVLDNLEAVAFHMPYTKMPIKVLNAYEEVVDDKNASIRIKRWRNHIPAAQDLSRQVGNIYTGALYLSLISMLISDESLKAGDRIGLFSYGSGTVGEFLTATVEPEYLNMLNKDWIITHFYRRRELTVAEYEKMFNETVPQIDGVIEIKTKSSEREFYLALVDEHRRYYRFNQDK